MFPDSHSLLSELTVSDFSSLLLAYGLILILIDFITDKILYNLSLKKESAFNEHIRNR